MTRGSRARALFLPAALSVAFAPTVEAQIRRQASVQPVASVRQGMVQLGAGFDVRTGTLRPLSRLRGDLFTMPVLSLRWALSDGALLDLTVPLYGKLRGAPADSSLIPLDPEAADGCTADFGDATIGVAFVPWRARRGPFAGGEVRVTLPNSDERKGIGINSTAVRLAALGGWRDADWSATASLGVEIIEAPLDAFEQNDVVAYALELLWGGSAPWRLGAGIDGRASTRGRALPGTEDRGEWYASVERYWEPWVIDLAVGRGYTARSGGWTVRGGVAVSVGSRTGDPRRPR